MKIYTHTTLKGVVHFKFFIGGGGALSTGDFSMSDEARFEGYNLAYGCASSHWRLATTDERFVAINGLDDVEREMLELPHVGGYGVA